MSDKTSMQATFERRFYWSWMSLSLLWLEGVGVGFSIGCWLVRHGVIQ